MPPAAPIVALVAATPRMNLRRDDLSAICPFMLPLPNDLARHLGKAYKQHPTSQPYGLLERYGRPRLSLTDLLQRVRGLVAHSRPAALSAFGAHRTMERPIVPLTRVDSAHTAS